MLSDDKLESMTNRMVVQESRSQMNMLDAMNDEIKFLETSYKAHCTCELQARDWIILVH